MLPGRQYTPTDFLWMALRRWWLIGASALLGGYVGLIVSSKVPRSFQSEMLIQVVPQRVPSSFVQTTVTLTTVERLSALTEQIMSRTELERLIVGMNLYPAERARLPMEDVVGRMRSQVKVEPVLGTRIGPAGRDADSFYVRFSYPEADTARRVTERLGGLFRDFNAQDRGSLAKQTEDFLKTALADSRARLEETEEKLRRFREKNAGRLPTQLAYNQQALHNNQTRGLALSEQLARDRLRKDVLESQYADASAEVLVPAAAAGALQSAQPQAGGNPAPTGTTAQQLAAARQALVGFELTRTQEHPDVTAAKALIKTLEAQLAAEQLARAKAGEAAGQVPQVTPAGFDERELARQKRLREMATEIDTLKREIARKEAEEQKILADSADLQRRIEQVPGVESEWIALTRDYDTQSTAYRALLTKSEAAGLSASLEEREIGEQFKILDRARTPVRPTGLSTRTINAIGVAIGLGVGLLIAAALELRDRTFRHADDIVEVLKLPVIALVPQVLSNADRRRIRRRGQLSVAATAVVVLAAGYGFWAMKLWRYIG